MKKTEDTKLKQAVALKYNDKSMSAPQLVAKGKGLIAENMIEKAKENNLPIHEDKALVELLSQLDINETIPEQLYEAVAEIFAYIYKVNQAFKNK